MLVNCSLNLQTLDLFCILVASLGLGHHHLAELVEVHRAGPVLVELLKYELLGFCLVLVRRTNVWKAHITMMATSLYPPPTFLLQDLALLRRRRK